MNNCSFIGRIGKDAECRYTQGGKAVAGWSIAVDVGYGDNKTTLWIDCSLWGDRAEKLAQYIRKRDRIGVTGEIGTREHDGKTYITLRVADVTLIGDKRDGESQPSERPQRPSSGSPPRGETRSSGGSLDPDDDIPFAPPINRRNWCALS